MEFNKVNDNEVNTYNYMHGELHMSKVGVDTWREFVSIPLE